MMGGIDDDAVWLGLLVALLGMLAVVVGVVVLVDVTRRATRLVRDRRRSPDAAALGAVAVAAAVTAVIRGWAAAAVVGAIVLLTWRAAETILIARPSRTQRRMTWRRMTLLTLSVAAVAMVR